MTQRKIIIGNRIPRSYFITSGVGESDRGIHAGSFDIALKNAGIHNYNLVAYSSILPIGAIRTDRPVAYDHGAVCEVIIAQCSAKQGERATAGIIIGWIYDGKKKVGGLVAEYPGSLGYAMDKIHDKDEVEDRLRNNIEEMFKIRCAGTNLKLKDIEIIGIESIIPQKKFGTSVVAICFTDYTVPVIEEK